MRKNAGGAGGRAADEQNGNGHAHRTHTNMLAQIANK